MLRIAVVISNLIPAGHSLGALKQFFLKDH